MPCLRSMADNVTSPTSSITVALSGYIIVTSSSTGDGERYSDHMRVGLKSSFEVRHAGFLLDARGDRLDLRSSSNQRGTLSAGLYLNLQWTSFPILNMRGGPCIGMTSLRRYELRGKVRKEVHVYEFIVGRGQREALRGSVHTNRGCLMPG